MAVASHRTAANCANLIGSKPDPVARMSTAGPRGSEMPAAEWLESPCFRRLIQRVACQYGLAGEDLPDLLQETRIALWETGLKTPVPPAWIIRTASHKAVDLVRAGIRRRVQNRRAARALPSCTTPDAEIKLLLHARVDELPARLHQFYELHYLQGFSEREIARSLGLCRSSVRWLDRCCRRCITGGGLPRSSPARSGSRTAPDVHPSAISKAPTFSSSTS